MIPSTHGFPGLGARKVAPPPVTGPLLRVVDLPVGFELAAGEALTVAGPNGAGKSTLLRAIAGSVRPPVRVAHVLEGRRVFRDLTVAENLRIGGFRLRGRRAVAERVAWTLERFPLLAARVDIPAGRLSGGEQQLLAIATGLVCEPDVLLLDEPCVGLAAGAVALVAGVVVETGAAVVVAEPHPTLFPSAPVRWLGPHDARELSAR